MDADGNPSGSAELISINEFIKKVENGADGCFVTIQGCLWYNTSISDWVYTMEYKDVALSPESQTSTSTSTTTSTSETTEEDPNVMTTDEAAQVDDVRTNLQVTNKVTAEGRINEPVLMMGTSFNRTVDNTTTAVLSNILLEFKDLSEVDNPDTEYLYINMFGDIVDKDDMVILPAAANPLYYKDDKSYYPYTVAFTNSYPTIVNGCSDLVVSGSGNLGKYIMMLNEESSTTLGTTMQEFNKGESKTTTKAMKLKSLHSLDSMSEMNTVGFSSTFQYNDDDKLNIFNSKRHVLDFDNSWDDSEEGSSLFLYALIAPSASVMYKDTALFPYDSTQDTNYTLAGVIAQSCYAYLTKDDQENKDLERLNTT